ncbi:MAG: hypothetical protein CVV44_13715 [Spirochaetae bacterium HGW-Spirochaetae-1]|jgi:hypothetical protein|nr:MAG: hypothetical protein CVV44_13715 [Spirochaetae bacterium HGW-Spirochaetae-1]
MKLIRKYLMIYAVLFIAVLSGCDVETAGVMVGDMDDGLSSDYFITSLTVDAPSLYNEDDPNATKLALKYPFSPGEWENELDVPNGINTITVTAEKKDSWARIYLGDPDFGTELTNRDPSGPISLEVGENIVIITVVAQDGQELAYTIRVNRHTAGHADATLSELSINGADLTPAFDPAGGNRSFSASVNEDNIDVTAYASAAGDGAVVELRANSDEVADWSSIPLVSGMNVIEAICTAGDGVTSETYTLNVFRQQVTTTADLVALSITGTSINPDFDKDTTLYSVSLSASMIPVTLVVQAESSSATVAVSVNGTPAADLSAISLNEGYNSILIMVENPDSGTMKDYEITATVSTASANADLKSLRVGMGAMSTRPVHPGTFNRGDGTYHDPNSVRFTKSITDYVTVIYGFSSITVTAAVDDSAASGVQFAAVRYFGTAGAAAGVVSTQNYTGGTATATIDLDAGYVTVVSITVTAASGATKTYRLYAKLLNTDEFYWGIYGPSMDNSKETWTKPQPGTFDRDGYVSGHVNWVVTTAPVSTITLTNYNDGKLGYLYNDGGIVINGAHTADLESIFVKDGWDYTLNPPFHVRTAAGENVAELDYHLRVVNADPAEDPDSYTGIRYLGIEEWHLQYYSFAANRPYPFDNVYNWFEPWSDGQ